MKNQTVGIFELQMWIPEVQVEDILTGTEGGGHILVDYAVS